ncbi:MAG: DUF992 domain-containing protein [Phyllobacterium sp.]|uniref:DUF992 domain-containing protein n=1 Tax=Phyllobacterium sp. TaxID=1871046 RepID=UPI0030EFC961
MKKTLSMVFTGAVLAFVATNAADAADRARYRSPDLYGGVKIGYLSCTVGGGVGYLLGSAKEISCTFHSGLTGEGPEQYTGAIRKFGVDVGFTTTSSVLWAVFAPTAGYHRGALAGVYSGATAEATIGAGIGTNVLFGGTAGSIHLQPISVSGQIGLNVAATGTSMTLASTN